MPFFSVVVPTYNRAGLLERSLASVLGQSFRDFELIVVDDGSSDATAQRLAGYGEQLTVLTQANGGPGSARNLGLAHARGEYVVFLDSDDLFLPWSLASYHAAIREHDNPAFVLCKPERFRHDERFLSGRNEPLRTEYWQDFLEAAPARYPVSIAAAIRRDVLTRNGGFFEHRCAAEDQDLFLRLGTERGFAFIQAPTLYGYRQHKQTATADLEALFRGALIVLERDRQGDYAGGQARKEQRKLWLARKFRHNVRRCFEEGYLLAGYRLFARSLGYYLGPATWQELYRLPLLPIRRFIRR